jgi:hypothetical protein
MTPRNPTMPTRTPSKKKSASITENCEEMILDAVNQNVQDALKKLQYLKN